MRAIARRLKRKLMIGVAVVAVLAGGTAAVVMASQSSAHRHRAGTLAIAAGYLDVSEAQLRGELRAGKSLAQIADGTGGKSTAGLVDALVAAKRHAIDAALEAGVIKRAQADKLLSRLVARMTARVHRG
jgi:hypothetical protein